MVPSLLLLPDAQDFHPAQNDPHPPPRSQNRLFANALDNAPLSDERCARRRVLIQRAGRRRRGSDLPLAPSQPGQALSGPQDRDLGRPGLLLACAPGPLARPAAWRRPPLAAHRSPYSLETSAGGALLSGSTARPAERRKRRSRRRCCCRPDLPLLADRAGWLRSPATATARAPLLRRRGPERSGSGGSPRGAGEGRALCARLATASTMAGSSPYLDESQLRNLKAQYEAQNAGAAAAQIQALVDCVHALKIQVGILGERGAGVSTLIQALLDKLRRVEDPWAYFQEVPQPTKQPIAHTHPTYPNLILQDLPGFEVSEKPAAYLKRLGDLSKYSCFVMVVGGTGLGDAHLQVLKAIKQKGKAVLLARTKVDLDLHTAERRLRARYNPAEQLRLIRKELTETLAKNGLDTKKVFLVSGLEAERYEFAHFEDSLEGEVLNLKRRHDGNLEDLTPVSQKKMEELYKICQTGSMSEVPAVIQSALEDPVQIRLDVAVIGEAGSGKSSLVNALRGVGSGEPGAAPTGVTETTRKAMAYMLPMVPNLYLWDLPGVGVTEEDVSHLDLSRYDFFLLVASERYKHVHSCLARAIASAGKEAFFVRSKIDVDVEARSGGQPVSKEELQEHVRKSCMEALKKDGIHSPQVFLVSSLMSETYDLPLLQEALRSNAPDLKKKALRRIIPTVLPRLVRRKAKVLMKDVWMKSLQICLYCVERPNLDVAENLIATISSFCIDLGLDEASLVRTAQATGKSAQLLQAVVRSPFAKPLTSAYVLSLITKPVPLTSWAWSYVPYLGREAKLEPDVSFESTYGMLQQAVVGLSEDADRVLLAAYTE